MITSTKNRHIIDLRKLNQRKHRRNQNRFMVEGLQLISMAVECGHVPLDVFYCEDLFAGITAPSLLEQLAQAGGRLLAVNDNVMTTLSERDAPAGIIATFPLFSASLEETLSKANAPSLLIVVDRLQDPGNLGTLIRTADAVNATAFILLEPCVDPFDPKTVRGSMGSIFAMPLISVNEPDGLFKQLKQSGYKITGADGYQGKIPWQDGQAGLQDSVALVLGNEARGLSDDLREHITHWTRLPLLGQAESLNVAVAGGVLMYNWLAQNSLD